MEPLSAFLIKNTDHYDDLPILKDLINLKCLYSRQLARMPRQYIVKLLFDTYHESMILKINDKIVAGITFRSFDQQYFYQIAFLAVNNQNQCQGLGSVLMNKFKNYCQEKDIQYVFTFADNGAIGFFEKHGFSKNITLPEQQYKAYIKLYNGGRLMQCRFDLEHKIDFEKLKDQIQQTKNQIIQKVKSLICLAPYDIQKSSQIIASKANGQLLLQELAQFVPGLKEVGYDKEKHLNQDKRVTLNFLLYCQYFLDLASTKRNLLKDSIEEQREKRFFSQNELNKKVKIAKQYDFLIYKMQIQLLHGHFKYKDQFVDEFSLRLKKIIGPDENLKGKEKQFANKIKQLKYEFMKNQLDYQSKEKKTKNKSLPKI